MAIATLDQIKKAEELGYAHEPTPNRGSSFGQGYRRVWSLANGQWQTADVIGGLYRNHEKFDSLEDALQRPMKYVR